MSFIFNEFKREWTHLATNAPLKRLKIRKFNAIFYD